jgi:hypothetical protein
LPVLGNAVREDIEAERASALLAALGATIERWMPEDDHEGVEGIDLDRREERLRPKSTVAWCYGALGAAAASAAAARARGDVRALARASRTAFRCAEEVELVPDDFVCHGAAGALVMLSRFEGTPARDAVARLGDRLLETRIGALTAIDADLLTGASGIALALLVRAGATPSWDRVLGTSTRADS